MAGSAAQHGPDRPDLALLHVGGVGPGADDVLQRRVLARHAAGQAPLGPRTAGGRDVGGDLGRHRPAHPVGPGDRRRHLGRGPAAVPRAQRLSRGDLPHLLLQPARRSGRPHGGHALRGHRDHGPGRRGTAHGHAARSGRRRCRHSYRARRAVRRGDRAGPQPRRPPVQPHLPDRRRRRRAPGRLLRDRTRLPRCTDDSGRRGHGVGLAARAAARGRAGRGRTSTAGSPTCPPGYGSSRRTPPSPSRWPPRPRSAARRPASSSSGSTRTGRSTTATAASSICWPARSPRGWSTPAATRRSAAGPSRSPSSTGRRRTSSPTSATSSGPRSR